ncbi:hypothetical protein F5879DRAFT_926147 [Lentinula edodes]|nr:hypothetical protein F5879DRAFT_926147 [Lentinula edodes]
MSVTVQGHSCVAFKDLASYYSVLSHQYVRSNGLDDWRSSCVTLSVNIRLHNFAFTTCVDFILVDDLQNCDVVFGLQFSHPGSDPPLNSIPATETLLQNVIVANGVSDTYNTTQNMVGPGSFDNPGMISQSKANALPVAKLKQIMEALNIQEHILPNQPRISIVSVQLPTSDFQPGNESISESRFMLTHLLSNKLSLGTLRTTYLQSSHEPLVYLLLLNTPDTRAQPTCPSVVVDSTWLNGDCIPPTFKPVLDQNPYALLDEQGVSFNDLGESCPSLCRSCYSAL